MVLKPPTQVTPATLIANGSPFLNSIHRSDSRMIRISGGGGTMLVEAWISISLSLQPLQWNAYIVRHDEGTEISVTAIVHFISLIAVSISFALLERYLIYILVHEWKIQKNELRLNDFDHFTRFMQKALERAADVPMSNTLVYVAAQMDNSNGMRVGPLLPLSSTDLYSFRKD